MWDGWTSRAFVHIHVGRHTIRDEAIRLVDTWSSRRLAFQLVAPQHLRSRSDDAADLLVEDEVNGFLCTSPEAILTCYDELLADPILQKKVIEGGLRSVAPLAQKWKSIAEDLVS